MILSRNFISDYTKLNISTDELANKMLKIGNEYDKKSNIIYYLLYSYLKIVILSHQLEYQV